MMIIRRDHINSLFMYENLIIFSPIPCSLPSGGLHMSDVTCSPVSLPSGAPHVRWPLTSDQPLCRCGLCFLPVFAVTGHYPAWPGHTQPLTLHKQEELAFTNWWMARIIISWQTLINSIITWTTRNQYMCSVMFLIDAQVTETSVCCR